MKVNKKGKILLKQISKMNKVRCTICRQQLPTIKTLKSHYLGKHSKIQIIKELVRNCILNSTPNVIIKSKNRLKKNKYKTIYLHENVQITYSNDTIVIEDESSNDNLIELSFADSQNYPNTGQESNLTSIEPDKPIQKTLSLVQSKRRSRKSKKPKKVFHIGIRKISEIPKSLHENTGEFYECHCMEKSSAKLSSDTESCSETSKTVYYCSYCGNGYQNNAELTEHEKTHEFRCRICNQVLNIQNYREHVQQHVLRIYVCHLCGFEFICKEILLGHLGYHFEQQTLENVLNMEQDYNMYGYCNTSFSSGDYYSDINNIKFFLTYPYDHHYSRNMFRKVVCDICFQEFYVYDYEKHLKLAHFLTN